MEARCDAKAGDPARWLRRLTGGFDIIAIETPPADRVDHLPLVLAVAAPRALIVSIGAETALAPVHALLKSHPAVREAMTLPVGRGLTVAVKR
jgi:hypothetical protein